MKLCARNAWPTDDLAVLWPSLAPLKLNLQQVMLVVDTDDDERVLGGALFSDGGHEIAYVAEVLVLPHEKSAVIGAYLFEEIVDWARHEGKTLLMFHTATYGALLTRLVERGARVVLSPVTLVVLNTQGGS